MILELINLSKYLQLLVWHLQGLKLRMPSQCLRIQGWSIPHHVWSCPKRWGKSNRFSNFNFIRQRPLYSNQKSTHCVSHCAAVDLSELAERKKVMPSPSHSKITVVGMDIAKYLHSVLPDTTVFPEAQGTQICDSVHY